MKNCAVMIRKHEETESKCRALVCLRKLNEPKRIVARRATVNEDRRIEFNRGKIDMAPRSNYAENASGFEPYVDVEHPQADEINYEQPKASRRIFARRATIAEDCNFEQRNLPLSELNSQNNIVPNHSNADFGSPLDLSVSNRENVPQYRPIPALFPISSNKSNYNLHPVDPRPLPKNSHPITAAALPVNNRFRSNVLQPMPNVPLQMPDDPRPANYRRQLMEGDDHQMPNTMPNLADDPTGFVAYHRRRLEDLLAGNHIQEF